MNRIICSVLVLFVGTARADDTQSQAAVDAVLKCYQDEHYAAEYHSCDVGQVNSFYAIRKPTSCGVKIDVVVDRDLIADDLTNGTSTASYVDGVYGALMNQCAKSPALKRAVVSRIKKVEYRNYKSKKRPQVKVGTVISDEYAIVDGVLRVTPVGGSANNEENLTAWLATKLKAN